MIKVRVIDSVRGFKRDFWVNNPKKIEWYRAMHEHNPKFVKILKEKEDANMQ